MKLARTIFFAIALVLSNSSAMSESTSRISKVVPLIEAVLKSDPTLAKKLLDQGADPGERDAFSRTALHYASARDQMEIAKLILIFFNDIDVQDEDGFTPLMRSAQNGNSGIAQLLLNSGARTDLTNKDGKHARELALEQNHMAVVSAIDQRK